MSRRGNPYDNPQAESLMKTLQVEDVSLVEYETFDDFVAGVPRFIEACNERRLNSALGHSAPPCSRTATPPRPSKPPFDRVRPQGRTPGRM